MKATVSPANSAINDDQLKALLFAILVKKLGGSVEITQSDVDSVAYSRMEEDWYQDGRLAFRLIERPLSS